MPTAANERLLEPYRVVRRVTAGVDAPWPGTLVRLADGRSRVLTDASVFDDSWPGWHASEGGHVLACLDIARRTDGHDVVLPACPRRVADALRRRREARVELTNGERVTIAVSVLRGIAELARIPRTLDEASVTGEWWLTDAGRPVLATGLSSDDAVEASTRLLDELAEPSSPVWHDLIETITTRALTDPAVARLEDELFALARPEPLGDAVLAAPSASWRSEASSTARERSVTTPAEARERGTLFDSLARHVDADVSDLVSRTTTRVWRRWRERGTRTHGRPWAVAAGVAGLVIAVGAFWPGDAEPVAANTPAAEMADVIETGEVVETADTGEAPSLESAPPSEESTSPPESADDDHASVLARLLTARDACGSSVECLTEVQTDPRATFSAGPIDRNASDRSVTLLDDFGGVAVLRVDAPDEASQLVVIQRTDDSWLLRDVYAAQQP